MPIYEAEQLLLDLEPAIRGLAWRHRVPGCIDFDDLAQELRIALLAELDRLDATRVTPESLKAWAVQRLKMRVVDVLRRIGPYDRRRRVRRVEIPESQVGADDRPEHDPPCTLSAAGVDRVDWADLVDRVASEPPAVRAAVMRCEGLRQIEIAGRLGISETRVSQMLRDDDGRIADRLRHLVAGRSIPVPPANSKGPMMNDTPDQPDPVDRMLDVFASADASTLERIDARIQLKRQELDRLLSMRKAIERAIQAPRKPKRKANRKPEGTAKPLRKPSRRLGDRILDAIAGGSMTDVQLAEQLDVTPHAITIAAARNKRLQIDTEGDVTTITAKGGQ